MLRIADKTSTVFLYDSIGEIDLKQVPTNIESNTKLFNSIVDRHDYDEYESNRWFGAPSQAEAEKRMRFGWAEGADRLQEIATKQIEFKSLRRRRFKSDQGDELDIHAVYRGDLSTCWTSTKRLNRSGGKRSISLISDISCHAGERSDELFWAGAAVLKLAETLSESGYSVAIYGASGTCKIGDGKTKLEIANFVELKSEDAPLDVSNLASIIAMPAYKRIHIHGAMVKEADDRNFKCDAGLGIPSHELIGESVHKLPIPQNAFVQPKVRNKQQAEEWIDSVLNQIQPQD